MTPISEQGKADLYRSYHMIRVMSVDSTPISIDPNSEIGRRLRETASTKQPLLVDIGDATYSVTAKAETTGPLSAPTAEEAKAAIAAITNVAGS